MLIIYHVITTYHLMEAWVHSVCEYSNDNTFMLLYDDVLLEKYPNIESIDRFNRFFAIPYRKSPRRSEELNDWMESVFSDVLADDVDEIYVAGAQFYFSEYLIRHDVPFVYMEEASGRLSKPEVVMENDKVLNMCRYNISNNNGMYTGDNALVKYRIGNKKAQLEGFDFLGCKHFDLIEELNKVDEKIIDNILIFFGAPTSYHISDNTAVMLTQHFTNLRMMSLAQQVDIYKDTIDYYLGNKDVILKLHPDDQVSYLDFIPKENIISTKFPSELLPYIFDRGIPLVATISSTGIFGFQSVCKNLLYFDTNYEQNYVYNSIIYTALVFIKIAVSPKAEIVYLGDNHSQICNMIKFSDIENDFKLNYMPDEKTEFNVVVIDSLDYLTELRAKGIEYKQKVLIILNPDLYPIIENDNDKKYVCDSMVLKELNEYVDNICERKIFGIVGDDKRMEALSFEGEKRFKCSGKKIKVDSNSELENRLNITLGILDATEKRLKYYIDKEKDSQDDNSRF